MNTTTRRPATVGRRTVGALRILLAAAVRYGVITPASLPAAEQPAPTHITEPAPVETPAAPARAEEPTGLFAEDEMPPLADIEAAAASFLQASEQARVADRARRAARKVLDRLPAGRHGRFVIERIDNAREVADLDAIRAIFAAHDLGDVPMKMCTPSLKVSLATEPLAGAGI